MADLNRCSTRQGVAPSIRARLKTTMRALVLLPLLLLLVAIINIGLHHSLGCGYFGYFGWFKMILTSSPGITMNVLTQAMMGPLAAPVSTSSRSMRDEIMLLAEGLNLTVQVSTPAGNDTATNTSTHSNSNSNSNYPVLFVPGMFATQLETQLTNRPKPHWWLPSWLCRTTTKDYQQVWFLQHPYLNLLPFVIDCYTETLLLKWNITTTSTTTSNSAIHIQQQAHKLPYMTGIDTRTRPSFDSVVDHSYYHGYAHLLTQYYGYKPHQNMIAQPFDWRVGPETWMRPGQEFEQMKTSIEQVVAKNHGKGVVAVSISAGGPFLALFLNQYVDQAWKDKYIHALFSVSGAFSGTAIAPMQYLSLQQNVVIPIDKVPKYVVDRFSRILQSTSSLSWLFPNEDSFHAPIITTPSKQYHAHELADALTHAGYTEQAHLYLANRPYFGGTHLVPGVRTYCLSGYGVPTMTAIEYDTDDMTGPPTVTGWDDGDNCVTVESLRQCDAWADAQKEPVHAYHFFNQSHTELLSHPNVIRQFLDVVTGTISHQVAKGQGPHVDEQGYTSSYSS
jgi:lysophospholipase III